MSLAFILGLVAPAAAASAHGEAPAGPEDLWAHWAPEPAILLGISLAAALYAAGLRNLWQRAGRSRGISWPRAAAYFGGIAVLAIALLSPLEPLTGALFSAHMTQHLLLTLAAPPLLIAGRPLVAFAWALPRSARPVLGSLGHHPLVRGTWGVLRRSAVAWTIFAVVLWAWHAPALYQAAVNDDVVHGAEHGMMLSASLLYWWTIMHPLQSAGFGIALVSLFTTAMHSTILGAILTFSSTLWYTVYEPRTASWGLTPMEDQQLAGLVMWVPGGIVYLVALGLVFFTWMQRLEREAIRSERASAPQPPG